MKKKLLILITTLMLILNFKYDVKADGEAPSSNGYDVVVSNKNGTALYNEENKIVTTIPYKDVATVTYERLDDGEKKIYVKYKEYDGFWSYYVKAEDVIPKDYDLSKARRLEKKQEVIVFNKTGVVLYEGPSEVYDKVPKTIPNGTTITYQYVASDYGVWAYVKYDGAEGWLWIGTGKEDTIGYVVDKYPYQIEILTIKNDAKLYNSIYTEESDVKNTIKTETKLSCKYGYSNKCYTEYNGELGWIKLNENFVYKPTKESDDTYHRDAKLLTVYDTNIYKDLSFKDKYDVKIPGDTFVTEFYYQEYNYEYGAFGNYYVNYKNKKGWLKAEDIAFFGFTNDQQILQKSVNIYQKPDLDSEKIGNIANGEKVRNHCDKWNEASDGTPVCWTYITYNGVTGWINEFERNTDNGNNDDNNDIIIDKDEEKTNWFKSLTPLQFSLLCIGGACILAATSIVIIVLIKKNNDKKAKDNKKENDKDTKEEIKKTETNGPKTEQVEKTDETVKIENMKETTEEQAPIKK